MSLPDELRDPQGPGPSAPRFFWIEGERYGQEHLYHWTRNCPWISVATWYGARLISSVAPPPGASDAARVMRFLEDRKQDAAGYPGVDDAPISVTGHGRWLCSVCRHLPPRSEAPPRRVDEERCEQCGCSREFHVDCGVPRDGACGMAWAEVVVHGSGGRWVGLTYCPCDRYAPPARREHELEDWRPLTSAEIRFYSGGLN